MSLQKGKIFRLWSALRPEELGLFRRFLVSPYHNTNPTLINLYDYGCRWYPHFPEEKLQKEAVHRVLFKGKKYEEKRIRDLYSDLTLQLESFFALETWREEDGKRSYLAPALANRGLWEEFFRTAQKRLAQLEEEKTGAEVLLERWKLQQKVWAEDRSRAAEPGQSLEWFFALSSLRKWVSIASDPGFQAIGFQPPFGEAVIKFVKEAGEEAPPACPIYLGLLPLFLEKPDQGQFLELWKSFQAGIEEIQPDDQRAIWEALLNFAIRVIREQDPVFSKITWELYRFGMARNLLLEQGIIPDVRFTNIVINGANLGELDAVEDFIREYADKLAPDIRENALALALAYRDYNQGNLDAVIGLLREVQYTNDGYAVRGRSLLLRTYYEKAVKDNYLSPELLSHLDAFRLYIRRNARLTELRKKSYFNLIAIVRRMALLDANPDTRPDQIQKLEEAVRETENLVAKDWVLQKIVELRNR